MKNNLHISISLIILAIAILVGSFYMGNRLREATLDHSNQHEAYLLTSEEAAEFLGITPLSFKEFEDNDAYYGLPYITVQSERYYTKENLKIWVLNHTENKDNIMNFYYNSK